jgi:hypothetical protein
MPQWWRRLHPSAMLAKSKWRQSCSHRWRREHRCKLPPSYGRADHTRIGWWLSAVGAFSGPGGCRCSAGKVGNQNPYREPRPGNDKIGVAPVTATTPPPFPLLFESPAQKSIDQSAVDGANNPQQNLSSHAL